MTSLTMNSCAVSMSELKNGVTFSPCMSVSFTVSNSGLKNDALSVFM